MCCFRDRVEERRIRGRAISVCAILLVCLALRAALFNHSRWSLCGANRYGVSFADPYTPCLGFFPSVVSLRTVACPAPGLRTKFTFSGFKQTPEHRLQLKISKTSGSFLHVSGRIRNFARRRTISGNSLNLIRDFLGNRFRDSLKNTRIRPTGFSPLDSRPRATRPMEPRQEVTLFLHHPLRGLTSKNSHQGTPWTLYH